MLKVITTEEQYSDALARVYELMQIDKADSSTLLAELDKLSLLVKNYELMHYPLPSPNP